MIWRIFGTDRSAGDGPLGSVSSGGRREARWPAHLTLLATLALLGCRESTSSSAPAPADLPPGSPAPEAAVEWLRDHAVPFRTDDPAAEDSDLALLGEAIGAARVVALGEATHGTREFFRMKHRLLQYLVRHKGFRSFVLEADGAASCDLDAYVHTGRGDPALFIRELKFWTWNTEEVVDMVRWMHAYNQTVGPDQAISFHGIDMQYPRSSSRKVVSFLKRVDPEAARRAERTYHCLGPLHDPNAIADQYPHKEVQEQMDCARGIRDIYQHLDRNRARYESKSPSAYACALFGARLLTQSEILFRVQSVRDHYYAENVQALLAPPENRKIVVWAHNTHIAGSYGAMGRRLKRKLEGGYVAVGFTFFDGSFRARPRSARGPAGPPRPIVAPPPPADSYEHALHRVGLARFWLDLRPLRSSSSSPLWLAGPHPMWRIGGGYDPAHSNSPARLPEDYDVLVFFDSAQASRYPARSE